MLDRKQNLVLEAYGAFFENRLAEAQALLSVPGQLPPRFAWSPHAGSLSFDIQSDILRSWLALPRSNGQQTPYYSDFDVLDGGKDFRYRVYGSILAETVGYDMTGKRLTEFPFTRRDAAVFFCGLSSGRFSQRTVLY